MEAEKAAVYGEKQALEQERTGIREELVKLEQEKMDLDTEKMGKTSFDFEFENAVKYEFNGLSFKKMDRLCVRRC